MNKIFVYVSSCVNLGFQAHKIAGPHKSKNNVNFKLMQVWIECGPSLTFTDYKPTSFSLHKKSVVMTKYHVSSFKSGLPLPSADVNSKNYYSNQGINFAFSYTSVSFYI